MRSERESAAMMEWPLRQYIMRLAMFSTLIVVAALLAGCSDESGKSFKLTGKETRQVLDPSQFTGQIRAAYAAAEKYRDVFNEVYCYCFCDQPPFNHKTLLSCFTEKHGAG
jgi:hypothetical protein